jgi:protein AroM
MPRTLGVATIGQAPRDDIADLFAAHAPAGTRVVLRGCLDGLSDQEIAARPPLSGADTLYTRLRGGHDVKISKKHVIERSPETLRLLREEDGCDAIVFACTGDFPAMEGDAGVLFPSRVLNGLASALLPEGRLGILLPLPEQAGKLKAKWERPGLEVVGEPLRPSATPEEAAAAAERLMAMKPDLVAMDCMSYGPALKAAVKPVLGGVPVILSITATARVMNEMLS